MAPLDNSGPKCDGCPTRRAARREQVVTLGRASWGGYTPPIAPQQNDSAKRLLLASKGAACAAGVPHNWSSTRLSRTTRPRDSHRPGPPLTTGRTAEKKRGDPLPTGTDCRWTKHHHWGSPPLRTPGGAPQVPSRQATS
ncbi:hypothetical protein NDU88_011262 [Pleurodeles waltl]|uniref:Uncharacterized protein n=1 Tax=Pleurodeles waltl TaxID=8319 RepID=A0AAV7PXY0_PLEWA|nr:hypothetical protein NDU88_011262 [Pleurodeles waltl]